MLAYSTDCDYLIHVDRVYDPDVEEWSAPASLPIRVRYQGHRVTRAGVIYEWRQVPGGRFDLIETRLPDRIRKAPKTD